ncbi:MAG: hypothetical protein HOI95_16820 [Chromatiales bacterium]|nr:hypothetical protein [Chromatiales bacterium]
MLIRRERARYFPRPERTGIEVRFVDFDTGAENSEAGHIGELYSRGAWQLGAV